MALCVRVSPVHSGCERARAIGFVRRALLELWYACVFACSYVFLPCAPLPPTCGVCGRAVSLREDFKWGLYDYGVHLTDEEFDMVLDFFDRNHDGVIDFTEFLVTLRGEMNERRLSFVREVCAVVSRSSVCTSSCVSLCVHESSCLSLLCVNVSSCLSLCAADVCMIDIVARGCVGRRSVVWTRTAAAS